MTPTKNESLPELPEPYFSPGAVSDQHGDPVNAQSLFTASQMYAFYRQGYEAALTREAPTEGVYESLKALIGCAVIYQPEALRADAEKVVEWMRATPPAPQRHPDALEDGSLSKSTAKRVDALRLAQGEDDALARFTEYFVRNYPGPDTIIHDPKWHAPRIFRVAQHCIDAATPATQPPHHDRGEVEKRARELLDRAAQEDRAWREHQGGFVRADAGEDARRVALRAITAALTEAKQQVGTASLDPFVALRDKWAVRSGSLTYDLAATQLDEAIEVAKQQGPGEADEHLRDAWTDFECEYLTDGNGYAPNTTYKACSDAFKAAWPDREAAYAAAVDAYEKCHGTRKSLTQHYAELYRREGTAPQVEAKRQTGEGESTVPAEKPESVCVHCFSPPYNWGMVCCKNYYRDPRTELLTTAQAKERRAAAAKPSGEWS